MADIFKAVSENSEGSFFVVSTCINCDTCRWMAPSVFKRIDNHSYVFHQPNTVDQKYSALRAAISCPVNAIGHSEKIQLIEEAADSLPIQITKQIFHCGYHDKKSFAATPYLLLRDEGNVLIDVPRFDLDLINNIQKMGGIKFIILTHKDDIGDYQKWAKEFDATTIMHTRDADQLKIDTLIKGGELFEFANDISIIPLPGHTEGSIGILFNDTLFSGDHLAWSDHEQKFIAWKNYCWYSWEEQITSMQKLSEIRFTTVLPGHGRRITFDQQQMTDELEKCIADMCLSSNT